MTEEITKSGLHVVRNKRDHVRPVTSADALRHMRAKEKVAFAESSDGANTIGTDFAQSYSCGPWTCYCAVRTWEGISRRDYGLCLHYKSSGHMSFVDRHDFMALNVSDLNDEVRGHVAEVIAGVMKQAGLENTRAQRASLIRAIDEFQRELHDTDVRRIRNANKEMRRETSPIKGAQFGTESPDGDREVLAEK